MKPETLDTRRMYRWERECYRSWRRYLWQIEPMGVLQEFAHTVFSYVGRRALAESVPVLAARGIDRGIHGRWVSVTYKWPDGNTEIRLARHDRRRYVVLHECAHVLKWTCNPHGPAFARQYLHLLEIFGWQPLDQPTFFRDQMLKFGIRIDER